MYFILHRCDPIPGRFLCENAVVAHHVSKGQVALLSDFYKPSDEEASPKCMYGCSTYPSKTLAIIHKNFIHLISRFRPRLQRQKQILPNGKLLRYHSFQIVFFKIFFACIHLQPSILRPLHQKGMNRTYLKNL